MATSRPFVYNTGSTLPYTDQVGDIAVGTGNVEYAANYGGLKWWGTLVSQCGFVPAPWINGDCGLDGCMPNPGIIWYWVR